MKLPIDQLDNIYVLSDSHYGHSNLVRGISTWDLSRKDVSGNILGVRDFDTLEEMNQTLIDNINSIVPTDGILFHLGDFSFGGKQNIEIFRNQINCKNLHLITGNHDKSIEKGQFDHLFSSRQKYLELEVGKHLKFVLFHFAIDSWDNLKRGAFHLHGHHHWTGNQRFGNGRKMDVGVDGNNLKPYKLADVIEMLKDRIFVGNNDHHV